jgi:REP element-mobilizing transposase RayT
MPHSLAAILIHLVFSTKNREPWITASIEPELHAYLTAVLWGCGCCPIAANGTEDHIHLLFGLSRTQALCDVVEEVKKRSSKWLKGKGDELASFYWQAGYGAFSIGQSGVPALRQYIARQKEHHRTRTFQDEFRALLRKYEIEFDERYVWD